MLGWVDKVGRSKLSGRDVFALVHVDGEDARSTGSLGCLNDCKPDGAKTEDGDRRTRLDLRRVPHGANACRNSTAQHADRGEIGSTVHFGYGDLGCDCILAEGRAAHCTQWGVGWGAGWGVGWGARLGLDACRVCIPYRIPYGSRNCHSNACGSHLGTRAQIPPVSGIPPTSGFPRPFLDPTSEVEIPPLLGSRPRAQIPRRAH